MPDRCFRAALWCDLLGMTTTRAARLERQITVVAVVLPFLGFIAALWLLWGGAVSGLDLAILAVMYAAVGFGVTIGFHRLFTHRSFEAKPWLRGTLAILGSMSVQGAGYGSGPAGDRPE